MSKISVLGSGGWGIALAIHAYKKGFDVVLWTPFDWEADELNSSRESKKLLSGVKIPEGIKITTDIEEVHGSFIVILAVPSFAVRQTAARLKNIDYEITVNVAKGFEKDSMKRLSEVISEELPNKDLVVLSGPSHAEEVARGVPTSVVVASHNEVAAAAVQHALIGEKFRIYTNSDVIGVEVGGALKNVIAVAAGFGIGLNIGDNTRAALITRGLAEIARLGVAMGADNTTFMGLSGLGDLIVTCMSQHSRNNRFGTLVGKGVSVEQALETVGTVEGYYAVEIAVKLANKYKIDMPITEQCYNILYGSEPVADAIMNLMMRPGKAEQEALWKI